MSMKNLADKIDSLAREYAENHYGTDIKYDMYWAYRTGYETALSEYNKSKWISVYDRIPDRSMSVLTVMITKIPNQSVKQYIRFDYWDNDKQKFEGTTMDGHRKITHWMPTPEYPNLEMRDEYEI